MVGDSNCQLFFAQLAVFTLVLIVPAVFAYCGWLIGKSKGRGCLGLLLGLFLGPLAILTIGFIQAKDLSKID